jgi:hypothetical protein
MGGTSKERKTILVWTIAVKIAGYLIKTFAYFSLCYFIIGKFFVSHVKKL